MEWIDWIVIEKNVVVDWYRVKDCLVGAVFWIALEGYRVAVCVGRERKGMD